MATKPPYVAERAVLGPTSRIVRRAVIYEADGVTPWLGGGAESRLIDGSVTVDATRDERRAMDITLDNFDNALVHDPTGGFWYDKIIKLFRGVEVNEDDYPPSIVIIEDASESRGAQLRTVLQDAGFPDVQIRLGFSLATDLVGYDIVVSLANTGKTLKSALIRGFYNGGGRVFTVGNDTTSTEFPEVIATTAAKTTAAAYTIAPITTLAHPLEAGWAAANQSTDTGTRITGVAAGAFAVSQTTLESANYYGIVAATNTIGGRWVHLHDYNFGGEVDKFIKTAFGWLNPVVPVKYWESQIGEFMIDRISESHFPHHVKVTGRDYTKKCMTSKFAVATAFVAGQAPETIVRTIATNAGISKMIMPVTGKTVQGQFYFDRGTDRWTAMKQIADAYGYEIFFDPQGYLIMREYQDPVFAALSHVLSVGPTGNLVSYEKATNDTRIYNHIVVTGESADQSIPPVSAQSTNTEPSSPTRIARLGDRVYQYTSSFITTVLQAQDVADKFLKIYALEEYDLNFSAICVWWLEVSEIVRFVDPRPGPSDPDRFLLSSLTIPMGLGAMSGNAKRVSVVK